jgi:hypothetical protein
MSFCYNFDPHKFLEDFDQYLEKTQNRIQSQENLEQIISKSETILNAHKTNHGTLYPV